MTTIDAPPTIDAAIDAPARVPLAQDCNTYCTHIATACPAGANQQYNPTLQNCMGTCAKFPVGTATDATGNTRGCRIWHVQNIELGMPADTHCAHAGPGGAALSAAAPGVCGDACTSFCKLEVTVCGTLDAPNANITVPAGSCGSPAGTNTNCFYQNEADCVTKCNAFVKTPLYSAATTSGATLACRLYHITNAAVSDTAAGTHCQHTGPAPTAACI
jgi:hypothetical protein